MVPLDLLECLSRLQVLITELDELRDSGSLAAITAQERLSVLPSSQHCKKYGGWIKEVDQGGWPLGLITVPKVDLISSGRCVSHTRTLRKCSIQKQVAGGGCSAEHTSGIFSNTCSWTGLANFQDAHPSRVSEKPGMVGTEVGFSMVEYAINLDNVLFRQ